MPGVRETPVSCFACVLCKARILTDETRSAKAGTLENRMNAEL